MLTRLADFLEWLSDLIRLYQGMREKEAEIKMLEEIETEGRIQPKVGRA